MASSRSHAWQVDEGTDDNLADIGTKGHDKVKLQKLAKLNNLVDLDVEQYPETIAASVSSGTSSKDLRAALAAVAIAAAAYLLLDHGGIGTDLLQQLACQHRRRE